MNKGFQSIYSVGVDGVSSEKGEMSRVGESFSRNDLNRMNRLAARYNTVNGEGFMEIKPIEEGSSRLAAYVQTDIASNSDFKRNFMSMQAIMHDEIYFDDIDRLATYIRDDKAREAFLDNPGADDILRELDKSAGIDSVAIDIACQSGGLREKSTPSGMDVPELHHLIRESALEQDSAAYSRSIPELLQEHGVSETEFEG